MDLDAPDDAVPEAPAPRPRSYVRERYKFHGWATPPGNLVAVYLEACERHRVPANSAVIAQLQRRVRLMQPGPWQRVSPPELLHPSAPTPATPATPNGRNHSYPQLPGASPGAQASASLAPGPSYSLSYSQASYAQPSYASQPSYSQAGLSPISSHMLVAAATQTSAELRELIQSHVYPLTLGPSLVAPAAAAASGGTTAAGKAGGIGVSSNGTGVHLGWTASSLQRPGQAQGSNGAHQQQQPPPLGPQSSQNHAETVTAAVLAMATGGPEGQGPIYSAKAVERVCVLVDPRTPWEQQLSAVGLVPGCRVVTEAEFQALLEAAAARVPLGELRQAALEVLSRPVGHGTLDVEGLAGALFDYLDVSGQGGVPASELRSAVSAFCPGAASDMYGLIERHPAVGRGGAEPVTRDEFVSILSALAPSLCPAGSSPALVRDKAEIAINAMLDTRIREPYGYDFSRCYLGPRGLLPVLDALSSDSAFTHLSLANCGLGCGAVEKLVDWLQGHPCLTALDLTNNLIADRGGLALTRLLETNTRIVELGIGSTYLLPPRPSRTHHDSLGPSPCEDARPLLEALAANRAARRSAPAEIVRALRQHGPELRAMCYSLLAREARAASAGAGAGPHGPPLRPASAPSDGRVPLSALREALGEVTSEWGFTADALDEVLHAERLLGTATANRTADDSGRLGVTYDELMQFLRSEDQVVRVAQAVRNHLLETKQLFFSLAPEPATAASMTAAGVAGPRTALSTVRQAIIAAASQPGSGWDVSEEDLQAVLTPAFLRAHCRAPPTGNARIPGAAVSVASAATALPSPSGQTTAAPGPAGLLVPEWSPAAAAAAGAGAVAGGGGGGGGVPSGRSSPAFSVASGQSAAAGSSGGSGAGSADMLISWPELCNTMLYLFNR